MILDKYSRPQRQDALLYRASLWGRFKIRMSTRSKQVFNATLCGEWGVGGRKIRQVRQTGIPLSAERLLSLGEGGASTRNQPDRMQLGVKLCVSRAIREDQGNCSMIGWIGWIWGLGVGRGRLTKTKVNIGSPPFHF